MFLVQAQQLVEDSLRVAVTLPIRGRPVAYEDVDGDGRRDLLVQDGLSAEWWTTCTTCEFPDRQISAVTTERVVGLFQLDADEAFEAVLSSRDSLLLFDDASQSAPALLQVLVDPVQAGFSFWGADAAVGDLDADGRIELVCGDGEGNVSVFEALPGQPFVLQQVLDTQGSYAYDISAVPPDGFVVGRQGTRNVTGDGFATTTYGFQWYRFVATQFVLDASWSFVTSTGDLHAASVFVGGSDALLLARGEDLYLLHRDGNVWQPGGWMPGADGVAPAVGDLQTDGTTRMVLRTRTGAQALQLQSQRGPHALAAESLGDGVLRLTWQPGDATLFRVQRRLAADPWQELVVTPSTSWIDSTASPRVVHTYRVQWLEAGEVRGATMPIEAASQPRPRLLAVAAIPPHTVRCTFTNALSPSTLQPRFFSLRSGTRSLSVQAVNVFGSGRLVDLLVEQEMACDTLQVEVDQVRDTQNGLLDPPRSQGMVLPPCEPVAFLVRRIIAQPQGFLVEYSEPPAADALLPGTYEVSWNGTAQTVTSVESRSGTAVFLTMQDPLVGRGIAYLVRVDAELRAASGAVLQSSATALEVLVEGDGAVALSVSPNPVRAGVPEVVFAEAAPDTRIDIYTLEGERVRHLEAARGGAIRWDLRTGSGARVGSGTYLYVATDATGRHIGRLVVIR
jgi:hypothetical protein